MKNADILANDMVFDLDECQEFFDTKLIQAFFQKELVCAFDDWFYLLLAVPESSIYWKNLKGQILGCNQKMLDIFGIGSTAALIGRTDEVILHKPEELQKIQSID